MQTNQSSTTSLKRNTRLTSIRESLKQLPLASLSSKIQNKIKRSKIKKLKESDSKEKEGESTQSETESSEHEQFQVGASEAFFEKYLLLQKLGQGCNACVYKCQDKFNQRVYAVKKARMQEEQIEEIKENFMMVQALKHPGVCSYKALYIDSKQHVTFTVMQYCPWPNLSECNVRNESEIKNIVKQLVSALQYIHQNGVCHRDIKPQNILYNPQQGKIKIIDFGISKKTLFDGEKRDMLTIIGSNCYFAPEIYLGGGYDQIVDLWSLGVTIFKLITGHTPFETQYQLQTIKNIVKGEVKFNQKQWEYLSSEAKDFVDKLLKEKTKRMTLSQCKKHLWFSN